MAEHPDGDLVSLPPMGEVADTVNEVVLDGQVAVEYPFTDVRAEGCDPGEEVIHVGVLVVRCTEFLADLLVHDGHDGILVRLLVRAGQDGNPGNGQDHQNGYDSFLHSSLIKNGKSLVSLFEHSLSLRSLPERKDGVAVCQLSSIPMIEIRSCKDTIKKMNQVLPIDGKCQFNPLTLRTRTYH